MKRCRGDKEFYLNVDIHKVWQPFINLGLILRGKGWPSQWQWSIVFICTGVESFNRNITPGTEGLGKREKLRMELKIHNFMRQERRRYLQK